MLFDFLECSAASSISPSCVYHLIVGDIKRKLCAQSRRLVNRQGEIKSVIPLRRTGWNLPDLLKPRRLLAEPYCLFVFLFILLNVKAKGGKKEDQEIHTQISNSEM